MSQRIRRLYHKQGIFGVCRGAKDFLYWQIWTETPFYTKGPYQEKRIDNQERWEFIKENIIEDYDSLLDIGCADGYFVYQADSIGLETRGIDVAKGRIESAKQRLPRGSQAQIELQHLNPENICELEGADVILLLTVHHNWISQFGEEKGTKMFKTVASKADLLIYEPPGDRFLTIEQPIKSEDSVNEYIKFIKQEFGDDVKILNHTLVDYMDRDPSSRSDPLFALDTSNYELN